MNHKRGDLPLTIHQEGTFRHRRKCVRHCASCWKSQHVHGSLSVTQLGKHQEPCLSSKCQKLPLSLEWQHLPQSQTSILEEGKLHIPKVLKAHTVPALRKLILWKGRVLTKSNKSYQAEEQDATRALNVVLVGQGKLA